MTISKEIKIERCREGSQISTRMMNEATGVALITPIRGWMSTWAQKKREASPARRIPQRQARRKPRVMREKENRTALQKEGSGRREMSLAATETGEASKIS